MRFNADCMQIVYTFNERSSRISTTRSHSHSHAHLHTHLYTYKGGIHTLGDGSGERERESGIQSTSCLFSANLILIKMRSADKWTKFKFQKVSYCYCWFSCFSFRFVSVCFVVGCISLFVLYDQFLNQRRSTDRINDNWINCNWNQNVIYRVTFVDYHGSHEMECFLHGTRPQFAIV